MKQASRLDAFFSKRDIKPRVPMHLKHHLMHFAQGLESITISNQNHPQLTFEYLEEWHQEKMSRMRREQKNKIILIGNGGSSAICSHIANDYIKGALRRALTFSDAALLTCLANDFGYAQVYAHLIDIHAFAGDLLIAISSSGKSENIINATKVAQDRGCEILTLSGFDKNNPLRSMGDLNIHVDIAHYGIVEMIHQLLLHGLIDTYKANSQHWTYHPANANKAPNI